MDNFLEVCTKVMFGIIEGESPTDQQIEFTREQVLKFSKVFPARHHPSRIDYEYFTEIKDDRKER